MVSAFFPPTMSPFAILFGKALAFVATLTWPLQVLIWYLQSLFG